MQWCLAVLFLCSAFCALGNCEERTVVIGPRTVKAGEMDEIREEGPDWLLSLEDPLCMNSFRVRVLDSTGEEELPQETIYLHHLLINGVNIRNIPCPEYTYWNFVAGAGAELTDIEIPAPYAYKIKPGDEWDVRLHVVNPSKHEDIEYTIEYTMEVGNWTNEFTEVEGYLNSAAGCIDSDLDFDVPKNTSAASFIIHMDFPSTFDGTLVWTGGHLHRGGKNLYFSRTSTGEILFSANVHYDYNEDHPDFITSIDSSSQKISLEMGELLRITAIYDCSKKREGVMGILFGYATIDNLYDGEEPLPQIIGYDNPFPAPAELVIPEDSQSYVSTLENTSHVEYESPVNQSTEGVENTKEDKAVLGLVGSVGLVLMFAVAIALLIAAVVLFRIKAKRSIEIFD